MVDPSPGGSIPFTGLPCNPGFRYFLPPIRAPPQIPGMATGEQSRPGLATPRSRLPPWYSGPASFSGKGMSRWPFLLKHLSYSPAPIP